jgi:predicted RecB family nuclease
MKKDGNRLSLSATDLVGYLNCAHLTELDLAVANGQLKPPRFHDPFRQLLQERGSRHEQGYIEHLKVSGLTVAEIGGVGVDDKAIGRTREAMTAGAEVIVQGSFRKAEWVGRPDVLVRVEKPSALGAWSYEVVDTKLSRETKAGTVPQLCLYADLVEDVQGLRPERGYVVVPHTGFERRPYRMDDYGAYFRRVRSNLVDAVTIKAARVLYPEPCAHCDICRWAQRCDGQRRGDDHLSLVAGATKLQIEELKRRGVNTVAALAAMQSPLAWKPSRGARASYERIREQARLQVEGRATGQILHELLAIEAGFGLAALPEPSPGDVFFDLEGDPFVGERGIEYLFGYAYGETNGTVTYVADWALQRDDEKAVFERFIDFVIGRLKIWPDLHIYHFAPYEPAALKRLMGRYASRENELDSLLRGARFVDLYSVVRNGIRASVESYSIKKLEPLYGYRRDVDLIDANRALFKIEAHLELEDSEFIALDDLDAVAGYNRDDCLSTQGLRDWLEALRRTLVAAGMDVPRPGPSPGEPSEPLAERQARIEALITRLTEGVPVHPELRVPEQHARWLLAYLLDWNRREQKAAWWEHFRLCRLSADELLDERAGLSGLTFVGRVGGRPRNPIDRYSFPPQENEIRDQEAVYEAGGRAIGSIDAIGDDWVEIKKRRDSIDIHPAAVFAPETIFGVKVLDDSLERVGTYVADHGMGGEGPFFAARDLLIRASPRLGGEAIESAGESSLESALRVALALRGGVFPIQGPPGAGKTFTGARMICRLAAGGHTDGVTANSHKVIRNLLDAAIAAAAQMGIALDCAQKPKETEPDQPHLRFISNNQDLLDSIGRGCNVAGATAWFWAASDAADSVDVLFIDEAAQMSLANVLAASQAARTIVLLGDPQQLEQPMRGSHPDGTDVSALHYLLRGEQTIREDRGLFLPETWRLHPDICRFTSELFYENRLYSHPGLDGQCIRSPGRFSGSGLRYLGVPATGNQSSSLEEADAVRDIVEELLASGATWNNARGAEQSVTLDDILVIAPYNAQVFEIHERLPAARVGTVDKFQGQEAAIVIYSLTTSSFADAPRGMEFLYSLNRLNVATSRAKCLCLLVASPAVFDAECRTPRQMQLANAFCRYLEMARQ